MGFRLRSLGHEGLDATSYCYRIENIESELDPVNIGSKVCAGLSLSMKTDEFDRIFDEGGDVSECLDASRATRPQLDQKRINIDFPIWMLKSLDREARRLGIPRQSIIKMWIAEKLRDD